MTKEAVIPVVFKLEDLIEAKGWESLFEKFEELWNGKSGIGEQYGELVDCGVREKLPDVTLRISVVYKEVD